MIEIKIDGCICGEFAGASIDVNIDPNMKDYHKHCDFTFSTNSLERNKSKFYYNGELLAMIEHDPLGMPSEYFYIYDSLKSLGKDIGSDFIPPSYKLVETGLTGVTVLPDNKYSKRIGMVRGIGEYNLDSCWYKDVESVPNGKRYRHKLTNPDNPFLKDVEFTILPSIDTTILPPEHGKENRQMIDVGHGTIIATVEEYDITSLKFPRLNRSISIYNTGDISSGYTMIRHNDRIKEIQHSKKIGSMIEDTEGKLTLMTTLVDSYDEQERIIGENAKKFVDNVMKHDEEMKAAIEGAYRELAHNIDVYYIKSDLNVSEGHDYFYITDNRTFWGLYRTYVAPNLVTDNAAIPINIVYEHLREDNHPTYYSYKSKYYQYGNLIYSKSIIEENEHSEYIEETEDLKVVCKVEKSVDNDETKYSVSITRQTGGSGYLKDIIERFVDIYKYGADKYVQALESIIKYEHCGEFQPVSMYDYLRKIESVCKDPRSAMRWHNTFVNTRDSLKILDINLITEPSNIMNWAKVMLWYEGDNKHGICDEFKLLDRIPWSDFMFPINIKYDPKGWLNYTEVDKDDTFEESGIDEEDPKVDVDEDEIPTASNACEAMYMDN